MKSTVRFLLVALCMVALVSSLVTAQDLQQQISKLGTEAAKGYITPILAGWGNDLNSAIYYSADLHDVLGFDIGIKFAMSKFVDADKTYSLQLPGSIAVKASQLGYTVPNDPTLTFVAGTDYVQQVTANTAVGDKASTVVKLRSAKSVNIPGYGSVSLPVNKTLLELPGGFDMGSLGVPLPMPQLNLGLPFGLEFMLRYVPTIKAGDVGKFNYTGFGFRYDIDQWLPLFPVDIAVHFMTQKMNFISSTDKDIFSAKATAYGVSVSKKLLILTLYGGFQLESSTLTLADYQYAGNDPTLLLPNGQGMIVKGFDVPGTNSSRFTVGVRMLLLIVNVHAEYSIAKNPVIAIGAGISLR
jgi:hypothetical protein